ncbi:MAG: FeoB-associated Cys-rich membrane protein [Provencibacterium sp.]|nr:FeoB-associated Cys-rich membrane protein [Provencibacterium sp.]
MPAVLGNFIVIAVLTVVVILVVRSLWKSHKAGGHCNGDCTSCACCHGRRKIK